MYLYDRVHEHLITLDMETLQKTLDNYLENAREKIVIEALDYLRSEDVRNKRSKRYETKLKYVVFP